MGTDRRTDREKTLGAYELRRMFEMKTTVT
jgi:hypothetical protein